MSTILIIEDEPEFRLTLTAYLEDSGFTIFEAADGQEGLEVFSRIKPDIVLTDLRMPKLDGFGVIAVITKESPATPVIAFTGTGDRMAANKAINLGARGCLLKPIENLCILEDAIVKALEQSKKEYGTAEHT